MGGRVRVWKMLSADGRWSGWVGGSVLGVELGRRGRVK